ncbi:hypothetical protein B566_EDAN007696 [Ephemera danica]|nr:hypothetical protein B566_EDAN007696 [Ephemera danica]
MCIVTDMMLGSSIYCFKSVSPSVFHQKKLNRVVTATVTIRCQKVHTIKEREELKRCYKVLNLPHDSDQEQLRSSFLAMVKKYHPDSGSPEANAAKFQEIEAAYRIVQNKFSKQRQYLSFDGVGYGTPQQRQKQHQMYRAAVAIENLYDHRVGKLRGKSEEDSLIIQDKKAAKKIKTRYGMERLVEDLIQESMARGEFDNLSGKGKPLPQAADNPYVDFVTHKINQASVLIDNGFVPEWISLQKEIREEAGKIREMLTKSRERLGLLPLTSADERLWEESVQKVQSLVQQLNIKINKYNLVVPLMKKQMLLFKLEREADQILQHVQPRQDQRGDTYTLDSTVNKSQTSPTDNSNGLFSLLSSFFFH